MRRQHYSRDYLSPLHRTSEGPFVRILHRMWKTRDVPKRWSEGVSSCRHYNPDWVYCHWTDIELRQLIAERQPDLLDVYDQYPYPIQRADAARYVVLYHYAGVYLDLDIKCRREFDDVLGGNDDAGGRSAAVDVVLADAEPVGVVSDFLAVRRRQDPLMGHVVSGLARAAVDQPPWYVPQIPYLKVSPALLK